MSVTPYLCLGRLDVTHAIKLSRQVAIFAISRSNKLGVISGHPSIGGYFRTSTSDRFRSVVAGFGEPIVQPVDRHPGGRALQGSLRIPIAVREMDAGIHQ